MRLFRAGITRRRLLAVPLAAALPLPALHAAKAEAAARLSLLHVNDFHSRHDGLMASGASCSDDPGFCGGGSPRLVAAFHAMRRAALESGRSPLLLDAGDEFTGSLYYTAYRGMAELAMQRLWGCEAMALGNHEFDNGPANLARYARGGDTGPAAPFPLLSANLDISAEPLLQGLVRPHLLLQRGGARIGLVGLTTPETPGISSPGPNLRFTDPAEAAARSIHALRSEGATTIILLSHCGLLLDEQIAHNVQGVDVIVGGHSHTLLANVPGADGPCPVLVDGPDRAVRIVQAGAFGRALGSLDVDLAENGRVLRHAGGPRLLTADLPEDAEALATRAHFAQGLEEARSRPVGLARADFMLQGCRSGECALGDLVAEAMLAASPGASVALANGGGLRAGLSAGPISQADVLNVLPFGNGLMLLTLRGADLLAALENGLSRIDAHAGRFPQVAGLQLHWDPMAPTGSRVSDVTIRDEGRWRALEPAKAYRVVTISFLSRGGDGYTMLRDRALESRPVVMRVEEAVIQYLGRGPVSPQVDGRIALR